MACIMLLIMACIFILIYLLWQVKKNGLRATVVHLIVYAEKNFLKGANRSKMEYVIEKITALLPTPIRFFITPSEVEDFIQSVFDEIKEALDYEGGQG